MLSRVAESHFWIARNIERAESLARVLDGAASRAADLGRSGQARAGRLWSRVYTIAGIDLPAEAAYDASEVFARIAFDEDAPTSLVTCVRIARSNALSVRAELTSEVFECLNGLYHTVEQRVEDGVRLDEIDGFLRSIRDATQAFAGICDATLSHEDGWEFLQIGRYLQRAAMTARILRTHDPEDEARDWLRVLDACYALEAFARVQRSSWEPSAALAFLVQSVTFPRAIRSCVGEVDASLRRLSETPQNRTPNEAQRVSGRLRGLLEYIDDSFLDDGAAAVAERLARDLDALGSAVESTYFASVPIV